jgi:hypothetical protein
MMFFGPRARLMVGIISMALAPASSRRKPSLWLRFLANRRSFGLAGSIR